MQFPEFPADEQRRLARLRCLGVLDTPPEDVIDGFTRLASKATRMPIALVSLVDAERLWFKSTLGVRGVQQVPRAGSFCGHAIAHDGVFEVEDARTDARFSSYAIVTGKPHVRHYAGVPLVMPDGEAMGTLCVLAPEPGRLDAMQKELLAELAANVVKVLLLRERERHLDREKVVADASLLSELAPVGMFTADASGAVLHGNAQWVQMLGAADLAELTGFGWRRKIHAEDLPGVSRNWKQAVRDRQPYAGAFRTQPEDGGPVRWIKVRAKPVDARLAPISFVGTSVDVTETMRLEGELQRKNELLESVIEHLPCGLAVFGSDLKHVASNTTTRRMFDLPDAIFHDETTFESLSSHLASRGAYGPLAPDAAVAERVASLQAREPQRLERVLRNGTVVEILGSFMPDGSMIFTYTDVTTARRADAELRRALQAADQASQAKSDFLATMSHEIRTPLNGVIGLTQLLAGAQLPPMEADSVAMIDSCAKSLLSVVDNILDFSKIEAGRLTLDPVPTDLVQLVQEVSDVFSVRAAEKGIRFDLRHDPDLPRWISADPGRLRQILLNLLGNALKFTAEGGFSLRVSRSRADGADLLCCEVFDTGIGISPADQARLFTRFTQADGSSTRRHSGTGLGLAISRQIAQLMGGDVTVASRPGHGSTFTLRVPLQAAAAPRPVEAASSRAVQGHARILLAEDNEVNQLVATRMLEKLGYRDVTHACTGREAVAACSEAAFDIVLMDCQMPVMDGWEATAQLRTMGKQMPILAFTASATSTDRDRCMAAGMDDYLTKPIELEILADKMQRWLAGVERAPQPEPAVAARQAFDAATLTDHFLGDSDLFGQARDIFVRQTRQSFDALPARELDLAAVRKLMHRIRGAAATLGATWLAEVTLRLEHDEDASEAQMLAGLVEARAAFEAFVAQAREAVPS